MKTIIIGVGIIVLLLLCLVLAIKYAGKKSEEAKDNKKAAEAYKQNAEDIKTEWSCAYDLDNFVLYIYCDRDRDNVCIISPETFGKNY